MRISLKIEGKTTTGVRSSGSIEHIIENQKNKEFFRVKKMLASNMLTIIIAESIAVLLIISVAMQTEARTYKSIELTLELRDREKQCFHEDLEVGTKAELDFQVIDGGDLDVDVSIYSPSKTILYQSTKRTWDTHEWNSSETGQYTFCFGNEFSIYSHKLLFFELRLGDHQAADDDDDTGDGQESLSDRPDYRASLDVMKFQMEAQTIEENYESIMEAQTSQRLSEAQQRKRAQELNVRVMWWSAFETVAFVLIGILQVFAVKSFFTRHNSGYTLINS